MKTEVEFYKQPDDGALDEAGAPMGRGWYWACLKRDEWGDPLPGRVLGLSTGPYRTKREAETAWRHHKAWLARLKTVTDQMRPIEKESR